MAQRAEQEKEKQDEEEEERYEWEEAPIDNKPITARVPRSIEWYRFLQHQGWTDEDVLDRQRAVWVMESFEVYKYQSECGLLRQGLF